MVFRAWRHFIGMTSTLALACLLAATVHAQAPPSDPAGVTVFAEENYAGASHTWRLEARTPFQAIENMEERFAGPARSATVGKGVGALFFHDDFFVMRDEECGPSIGSSNDRSMWWRGRTADAVPMAPSGARDTEARPQLPERNFASLVVYDREHGPPPGIVLLERRLKFSSSCEDVAHRSFFNRVFIPIPEPPDRSSCWNKARVESNPEEAAAAFDGVSELLYMTPERLDFDYAQSRHNVRAVLYEEADCTGEFVTLDLGGDARSDVMLMNLGFRGRVESVEMIYVSGPFDPFYNVRQPARVATSKPEPQTPEAQTPEARTPEPQTPEPQTPEDVPLQETMRTTTPEPSRARAESPSPETPSSEDPSTEASSFEAPSSGNVSSGTPTPGTTSDTPGLSAVPEGPEEPRSTTESGDTARLRETPEPETPSRGGSSFTEPEAQAALAQPAIEPEASESTGVERFRYPVHDEFRLNFCYRWGEACGDPAAQAWCKDQGFAAAVDWKREQNIGHLFPTIVMGDDRICDKYLCDGFEWVSCAQ